MCSSAPKMRSTRFSALSFLFQTAGRMGLSGTHPWLEVGRRKPAWRTRSYRPADRPGLGHGNSPEERGQVEGLPPLIQPTKCHLLGLLLPSYQLVWGVAVLAAPPGQPGRGAVESNTCRVPSPLISQGPAFLKGLRVGRMLHCLISVCNEDSSARSSRGEKGGGTE